MKKRTLVAVISFLVLMGCGKKKGTLDDQVKAPPPPVQEEMPTPPPPEPEIDTAAIREEQLSQDAKMMLRPIYFGYDQHILSEESRNTLAEIGNFLNKYPEVNLTVEGHCDERGSAEYNMALGQKRADEARRYLVSYGVGSGRISSMSWGEERPAEEGNTEAEWAKNRRDEFTYGK